MSSLDTRLPILSFGMSVLLNLGGRTPASPRPAAGALGHRDGRQPGMAPRGVWCVLRPFPRP
jgi:hypothetical protein